MTIDQANWLIPALPCELQVSNQVGQALEQVIKNMLDVLKDAQRLQQLLAFSQKWRGYSENEKIEGVRLLRCFVKDHIVYRPDPLYEQLIKDPVCTWRQRQFGADCKSLTVFIYAVLYNLGLPRVANIFIYPKEQIGPCQWKQPSHIFPSTFIGGKEIYLDATIDNFNQLPSMPLEWRREYGA